tara:strand:+ start:3665 stop:4423 length:759 start_codon:yes stop_codon:yes gene_type:complete
MTNVIPQALGLKVNGIYHRYTIEKDPNSDATVRICNENTSGNGCSYLHIDNWNQQPGSTKIGYDPVSIAGELLGNGSITVNGDGTITESIIHYDYTYNTCDDPLTDPRCPNYESALLQYLLDNGLLDDPDVKDPYLDEYVQMQLDRKAEQEEADGNKEEIAEEEEKEEETLQEQLAVGGATEKIANAAQQNAMMLALSQAPKLNSYYAQDLQGGEYKENITLKDNEIVDNKRALRNLASDTKHREIVRSQYK